MDLADSQEAISRLTHGAAAAVFDALRLACSKDTAVTAGAIARRLPKTALCWLEQHEQQLPSPVQASGLQMVVIFLRVSSGGLPWLLELLERGRKLPDVALRAVLAAVEAEAASGGAAVLHRKGVLALLEPRLTREALRAMPQALLMPLAAAVTQTCLHCAEVSANWASNSLSAGGLVEWLQQEAKGASDDILRAFAGLVDVWVISGSGPDVMVALLGRAHSLPAAITQAACRGIMNQTRPTDVCSLQRAGIFGAVAAVLTADKLGSMTPAAVGDVMAAAASVCVGSAHPDAADLPRACTPGTLLWLRSRGGSERQAAKAMTPSGSGNQEPKHPEPQRPQWPYLIPETTALEYNWPETEKVQKRLHPQDVLHAEPAAGSPLEGDTKPTEPKGPHDSAYNAAIALLGYWLRHDQKCTITAEVLKSLDAAPQQVAAALQAVIREALGTREALLRAMEDASMPAPKILNLLGSQKTDIALQVRA